MRIKYNVFLFIFFIQPSLHVYGAHPDLIQINRSRHNINQTGMLTLGSWALANLAGSGVMMAHESGEKKYFHQMNVYWNIVNIGIAGLGYFGSHPQPDSLSLAESLREQVNIEKILLFNTGLDLVYITVGIYLLDKQNADEQMKGYGRSLIVQGSFLLIFDAVLYLIHNKNNDRYFDIFEELSLSHNGISLRINF